MNREEAIAKGITVQDIKHNMKRRCSWHDYHRKGTYMLTLVVDGRIPLLGVLKGETEAIVEESELGSIILNEEIKKIHQFYPTVDVWKVCIMPDHIHMIVRVNGDMQLSCTVTTQKKKTSVYVKNGWIVENEEVYL